MPRFEKGNKAAVNHGRPADHPLKGKVSMELWDAMIKLLHMKKEKVAERMANSPTLLEITAFKYINDSPAEVVDRFCGRIPQKTEHTGEDGKPITMTLNIKT